MDRVQEKDNTGLVGMPSPSGCSLSPSVSTAWNKILLDWEKRKRGTKYKGEKRGGSDLCGGNSRNLCGDKESYKPQFHVIQEETPWERTT